MVLHALFGEDSWRFAGMLGSFTFIYKFLINALPLVPIPDQLAILRSSRQRAQRQRERDLESGGAFDVDSPPSGASGSGSGMQTPLMMSSKHAEKRAQEIMRKRRGSHLSMSSEVVYSRLSGARWHAAFAGAVAGLSVLFEKKSRRITVAQQLFVRYVLLPALSWCTGTQASHQAAYKGHGMRGVLASVSRCHTAPFGSSL